MKTSVCRLTTLYIENDTGTRKKLGKEKHLEITKLKPTWKNNELSLSTNFQNEILFK